MAQTRKPREPKDPGRPRTLADYESAGMLTELPSQQWLVRNKDGFQFCTYPFSDEGRASAAKTASRIGGYVEAYTPAPTTYWKSGETHHDH